jgi:hypothetical protein
MARKGFIPGGGIARHDPDPCASDRVELIKEILKPIPDKERLLDVLESFEDCLFRRVMDEAKSEFVSEPDPLED